MVVDLVVGNARTCRAHPQVPLAHYDTHVPKERGKQRDVRGHDALLERKVNAEHRSGQERRLLRLGVPVPRVAHIQTLSYVRGAPRPVVNSVLRTPDGVVNVRPKAIL